MNISAKLDDAQARANRLLKVNFANLSMKELQAHHEELDKIGNILSRSSIGCKNNEKLLAEIGVVKSRCKDILHGIDIPTAPRRTEPALKVVNGPSSKRTSSQPVSAALAATG